MKKIHKTCVKAISKVAGKPLRFFTLYATFSCILNKQKNDLMFREHEKTFGDNDSVVCKGEVKREVTLSKGQMFHSKKDSLEELSSLLLLLQNNPYRNQGNRHKSFLLSLTLQILQRLTLYKNYTFIFRKSEFQSKS